MDERLLIKATPALLDGWCGPVVLRWPDGAEEAGAWWDDHFFSPECGDQVLWLPDDESHPAIYLDLSRAECRDRVARVINGGPMPPGVGLPPITETRNSPRFYVGVQWWSPTARDNNRAYYPGEGIPALADLDPHDDTRLPDGSRLVDALALAAVWREVSGE